MSGYRFLSLAKRSLICLFLASLVAMTAQAYLLLSDLRQSIRDGQAAAAQVMQDTRETLAEWREYTAELRAQLDNKKTQESIGLLLRSGNDINLGIKKFNTTLDELKAAIKDTSANLNENVLPKLVKEIERTSTNINENTLPEVGNTLKAATGAINQTSTAIETLSLDAHGMLRESRLAIEAMKFRVEDPHWDSIIQNLDAGMARGSEALFHVEQTTGLIYKKTKQLTRPIHWLWGGLRTAGKTAISVFVP